MTITYTNFGYGPGTIFDSVRDARRYGEERGFEFAVWSAEGRLVGSWSPLGGWRRG